MVRRYVEEKDDPDENQPPKQGFRGTGSVRRKRGRAGDSMYNRYVHEPPTLQHRQDEERGSLCHFYLNGDALNKKTTLCVSRKAFCSMEVLMRQLSDKLGHRINHVFTWPGCKMVTGLENIGEPDKHFVASTSKIVIKKYKYGGIDGTNGGNASAFSEKYSRNSYESRGTNRSMHASTSENSLRRGATNRPPIMIYVVSNLDRNNRERVYINPQTSQIFEANLDHIGQCISIERPPVTALFSSRPPFDKIDSYNKLFREIKLTDTFIACGLEGQPEELGDSARYGGSPRHNGYGPQTPRYQRNSVQQNGYPPEEQIDDRYGEADDDDGDDGSRQNGRMRNGGYDRSPVRGGARAKQQPARGSVEQQQRTPRQSYKQQQPTPRRNVPQRQVDRNDRRKSRNYEEAQEEQEEVEEDRRSQASDDSTDEKMQRRIDAMNRPKSGLDEDVLF